MRICTTRALTVVLVLGLALPVFGQQTIGPETKFSFGVDTTTIVDLGLPGLRASDIQVNLDMDQDGHQEFLWVNDYGGGLPSDTLYYAMLWENTGNDAYTPVWWYVFEEEGNNFPAVRATDMDEDGNQEICIVIPAVHRGIGGDPSDDRNPARLFFFEWDGTDNGFPTDEPTYSWNFDVAADSVDIRPASLETGDFDKDGDNELAVGFRRYRSGRGGALAVVQCQSQSVFRQVIAQLGELLKKERLVIFDACGGDAVADAPQKCSGHVCHSLFRCQSAEI